MEINAKTKVLLDVAGTKNDAGTGNGGWRDFEQAKKRFRPDLQPDSWQWINMFSFFKTLAQRGSAPPMDRLKEYFTRNDIALLVPSSDPNVKRVQKTSTLRFNSVVAKRFGDVRHEVAAKLTLLFFGFMVEPHEPWAYLVGFLGKDPNEGDAEEVTGSVCEATTISMLTESNYKWKRILSAENPDAADASQTDITEEQGSLSPTSPNVSETFSPAQFSPLAVTPLSNQTDEKSAQSSPSDLKRLPDQLGKALARFGPVDFKSSSNQADALTQSSSPAHTTPASSQDKGLAQLGLLVPPPEQESVASPQGVGSGASNTSSLGAGSCGVRPGVPARDESDASNDSGAREKEPITKTTYVEQQPYTKAMAPKEGDSVADMLWRRMGKPPPEKTKTAVATKQATAKDPVWVRLYGFQGIVPFDHNDPQSFSSAVRRLLSFGLDAAEGHGAAAVSTTTNRSQLPGAREFYVVVFNRATRQKKMEHLTPLDCDPSGSEFWKFLTHDYKPERDNDKYAIFVKRLNDPNVTAWSPSESQLDRDVACLIAYPETGSGQDPVSCPRAYVSFPKVTDQDLAVPRGNATRRASHVDIPSWVMTDWDALQVMPYLKTALDVLALPNGPTTSHEHAVFDLHTPKLGINTYSGNGLSTYGGLTTAPSFLQEIWPLTREKHLPTRLVKFVNKPLSKSQVIFFLPNEPSLRTGDMFHVRLQNGEARDTSPRNRKASVHGKIYSAMDFMFGKGGWKELDHLLLVHGPRVYGTATSTVDDYKFPVAVCGPPPNPPSVALEDEQARAAKDKETERTAQILAFNKYLCNLHAKGEPFVVLHPVWREEDTRMSAGNHMYSLARETTSGLNKGPAAKIPPLNSTADQFRRRLKALFRRLSGKPLPRDFDRWTFSIRSTLSRGDDGPGGSKGQQPVGAMPRYYIRPGMTDREWRFIRLHLTTRFACIDVVEDSKLDWHAAICASNPWGPRYHDAAPRTLPPTQAVSAPRGGDSSSVSGTQGAPSGGARGSSSSQVNTPGDNNKSRADVPPGSAPPATMQPPAIAPPVNPPANPPAPPANPHPAELSCPYDGCDFTYKPSDTHQAVQHIAAAHMVPQSRTCMFCDERKGHAWSDQDKVAHIQSRHKNVVDMLTGTKGGKIAATTAATSTPATSTPATSTPAANTAAAAAAAAPAKSAPAARLTIGQRLNASRTARTMSAANRQRQTGAASRPAATQFKLTSDHYCSRCLRKVPKSKTEVQEMRHHEDSTRSCGIPSVAGDAHDLPNLSGWVHKSDIVGTLKQIKDRFLKDNPGYVDTIYPLLARDSNGSRWRSDPNIETNKGNWGMPWPPGTGADDGGDGDGGDGDGGDGDGGDGDGGDGDGGDGDGGDGGDGGGGGDGDDVDGDGGGDGGDAGNGDGGDGGDGDGGNGGDGGGGGGGDGGGDGGDGGNGGDGGGDGANGADGTDGGGQDGNQDDGNNNPGQGGDGGDDSTDNQPNISSQQTPSKPPRVLGPIPGTSSSAKRKRHETKLGTGVTVDGAYKHDSSSSDSDDDLLPDVDDIDEFTKDNDPDGQNRHKNKKQKKKHYPLTTGLSTVKDKTYKPLGDDDEDEDDDFKNWLGEGEGGILGTARKKRKVTVEESDELKALEAKYPDLAKWRKGKDDETAAVSANKKTFDQESGTKKRKRLEGPDAQDQSTPHLV